MLSKRKLCKPHRTNSLAHSSIGTPSPLARLRLFVSIWFQVLFHLPQRDAFHLSLTVLVHYRSQEVLVLGHSRPGFVRDFTSPVLLKICHRRVKTPFAYGAITRFGRLFQDRSANNRICNSLFNYITQSANGGLSYVLK